MREERSSVKTLLEEPFSPTQVGHKSNRMSLGKNLKINTWDGRIWYPTFYDLDTVLGIDNSGLTLNSPL